MRPALVLGLVALAVGVGALGGGDATAALALRDHAESTEPGQLTGDLHLDAARELSRIRPWQAEFSACRQSLRAIESARLAELDAPRD